MEFSGYWTRNPEVMNAPMLRPHNMALANVLVPDGSYNTPMRNLRMRPSNPNVNKLLGDTRVPTGISRDKRETNKTLEGEGFFDDLKPSRLKRTFGQVMSDIKPVADVALDLLA